MIVVSDTRPEPGPARRPTTRPTPTGLGAYPRQRRGVGVWAFTLALLTVGALTHVAVRLRGIQIAYDLGRERRANTELEEQKRSLIIEIGMLKDPGRVIGIAHDKLQMGPPAPGDVIKLAPGVVLP